LPDLYSVFIFIKIIRLAKKLFLRQKCCTDTGYACTSSVASKRAIIKQLAKTFVGKRRTQFVSGVHQCIAVLCNVAFPLLGDWAAMYPYEAD
jgi:hypothetical protein